MQRTVLLHYHLFKNAGTSLDEILQENFPNGWVTQEFQGLADAVAHRQELARWIAEHPSATAFSSHTAALPPPEVEGVEIFPLVFVRHPVDRIVSAYSFERVQGDPGWASVLASHTTLRGYNEVRLSIPGDRQCRNFQVLRLSQLIPESDGTELERALKAIEVLPFVGIVEYFDRSMGVLKELIEAPFPHFTARNAVANVTRQLASSLEEKVEFLRAEIGHETFELIASANEDDAVLHAAALRRQEAIIAAGENKSALQAPDEK